MQNSGAFLNAIPSHSFGLSLLPANFQISLLRRRGLPVYSIFSSSSSPVPVSFPCPICGDLSDVYGDHALVCSSHGERIMRHDLLRNLLFKTAQSAGLSPVLEQRNLIEDSNTRPGDVFLPSWQRQPTAFDIVVTHPTCKSNLIEAARRSGAAMDKAKAEKFRKHGERCRRINIRFVPVAYETFGGLDKDAEFHLSKIAAKTAYKSSKPASVVVSHFKQRQSVLLHKSCAAMIIARAPPPPPPDIVGP